VPRDRACIFPALRALGRKALLFLPPSILQHVGSGLWNCSLLSKQRTEKGRHGSQSALFNGKNFDGSKCVARMHGCGGRDDEGRRRNESALVFTRKSS